MARPQRERDPRRESSVLQPTFAASQELLEAYTANAWEVAKLRRADAVRKAEMLESTTLPQRGATVSLREITKANLRDVLRLKVAPKQEQFVASNAVSIAQAYFDRETAWFRAVYADDRPVGFVMLEVEPQKSQVYLWRFMIDQRFQKLGFGARALQLVIDHARDRPGATELTLSHVPGPGNPSPFYEKLGFAGTGEVLEDEVIMRLKL